MKNLLLALSIVAAVSCGSKNNNSVDSGSVSTGSNSVNVMTSNLVDFEGSYDIVRMDTPDCGAAIRIERACNGYKLLSNITDNAEDFCNVNKGEMRVTRNPPNPDRNPPNPDRNPPNPDRNPPNPDSAVVVTQEANELKSIVKIADLAFTNTLTLNPNGILTKVSNLKSRVSRCVFQKR